MSYLDAMTSALAQIMDGLGVATWELPLHIRHRGKANRHPPLLEDLDLGSFVHLVQTLSILFKICAIRFVQCNILK